MSADCRVERLRQVNATARELLNEYYEAINVVVRDQPGDIERIVADPHGAMWVAYADSTPAGCVVLRDWPAIPGAGECKRLYVQPWARGRGIAAALMDAEEEYARSIGLEWIYLDSKDDLHDAIALYRRRGYVDCERYNDNPQATVFLRKRL